MTDESREVTSTWRVTRTLIAVAWLAIAAFFGFQIFEFGMAVDGIGYAHSDAPTYVTVILLTIVGAVIGLFAYAAYRSKRGYTLARLFGLAFCFIVFLLAALTAGWHYGRVCDTMQAPRACEAATWKQRDACSLGQDPVCYARLERACRLGGVSGCERLLERGHWNEEQVCEALSDKCAETRRCGSVEHPAHCDQDAVPFPEASEVAAACESFTEMCD